MKYQAFGFYIFTLWGGLFLVTNSVCADQFHLRDHLPGGRAAAMGGAYTALADDSSGLYYNPAGLSFSKEKDLAVTANAYSSSESTYFDAFNNQPLQEKSSVFFPGFLGANRSYDPVSIGYAYLTLEALDVNQNDQLNNISTESKGLYRYNRSQLESHSLIYAGLGFSVKMGANFSLGFSDFYYRRTSKASLHQLLQYNDGGIYSASLAYEILNQGHVPTVGVMFRSLPVSLGLMARVPQNYSDRTRVYTDEVEYLPGPGEKNETPTVRSARASANAIPELNPSSFAFGAAYLGDWLTMSSEASLHIPKADSRARVPLNTLEDLLPSEDGEEIPEEETSRLLPIINWSTGLEVRTGFLIGRAGVFSNNTITPQLKEGFQDQPTHIDLFGRSLGLAFKTQSSETSFVWIQQDGAGETQVIQGNSAIQRVESKSSTMLLATKVNL